MGVNYEWTIEHLDGEDIVDSDFADRLTDFLEKDFNDTSFGLVRNEGNEFAGLKERYWAYVENGVLPEYFSDAAGNKVAIKVPKDFHDELKAFKKRLKIKNKAI
jgi:hypothetical protein